MEVKKNWGNVNCTRGDKGKESKIITDSEQAEAFKDKMTSQDHLLKEAVYETRGSQFERSNNQLVKEEV